MQDDNLSSALLSNHAAHELSERLAKCQDFSEVLRREIQAGASGIRVFSADLEDANDFVVRKNRCADDFLNASCRLAVDFHSFKNGGMPRRREIVVNFGPGFTRGFCRE